MKRCDICQGPANKNGWRHEEGCPNKGLGKTNYVALAINIMLENYRKFPTKWEPVLKAMKIIDSK